MYLLKQRFEMFYDEIDEAYVLQVKNTLLSFLPFLKIYFQLRLDAIPLVVRKGLYYF